MKAGPISANALAFDPDRKPGGGDVGCVHRDGSITFRGRRYRTLAQLPPECTAFRAELGIQVQWRKIYRAIDPKVRKTG